MSVPGVGPITALAFMAAIEDVGRFGRMRDIGVYLGLTPKRYQSGETDIGLGISHQGDAMARHYLYEAANVLLTTVRKPSALKSWGLKLLKRRGPKRARVAVARKLAVLLGRIWKDGTHFAANCWASVRQLRGRKRIPRKEESIRRDRRYQPRQRLTRLGRTGERATCWLQPIIGFAFNTMRRPLVQTATGQDDDAGLDRTSERTTILRTHGPAMTINT